MILYPENEIDNNLQEIFSKEEVENLDEKKLDLIGINISTKANDETLFKIYYKHEFSFEKYKNFDETDKSPLLDYFIEKEIPNEINLIKYKDKNLISRIAVRLAETSRNDKVIIKLFKYLEENVSFFKKYKKEILYLSKMKTRDFGLGYVYRSLFWISTVYENEETATLKLYWGNRIDDGDNFQNNVYYLKYLNESNIPEFQKLIPLTKEVLKYCSGNLALEGVDYKKDKAQKHKIYITDLSNPYNGLIAMFSNNKEFVEKVNKIKNWHKLHKEMYFDFLAIGIDEKGNNVFNFYFSMKKNEHSFSLV